MKPTDLAEILWNVRCAIERFGKKKLETVSLRNIDALVTLHLMNMGHDPGATPEAADDLKLKMLRSGVTHGHVQAADAPPCVISECLERVVELDNAQATPYRVVGRWAEFVNRAVLAPEIVPDDPVLPVRPWVKARKIDVNDFTAAAQAFADWTCEVNEKFAAVRREGE